MMKIKNLLAGLFSIALMASTVGCANRSTSAIPKPKISMKSMTQVSDNYFMEITCDMPKDWSMEPKDFFAITGCDKENHPTDILTIISYERGGGDAAKIPEEVMQIYRDLFDGKPEKYKSFLNFKLRPTYFGTEEYESQTNFLKEFKYRNYKGKNGKITEVRYAYEHNKKMIRRIECIRQDIPYMVTGEFNDSSDISSGDIALWAANTLKVIEDFSRA